MTCFFALHLFLRGKLDICGRDDFFFALHLLLRGKLDIFGFILVNISMSFFSANCNYFFSFFNDSWLDSLRMKEDKNLVCFCMHF